MSSSRNKISLTTIALCLSLIAHAVLLGAMVKVYARSLERIFFPGFARVMVREESPLMDQLGKAGALGDAIDASPGDEPMQAREADQNQAFLTRDPPGLPNSIPMQVAALASPNEAVEASHEERAVPFGVSGIAAQTAPQISPQIAPQHESPRAIAKTTDTPTPPTSARPAAPNGIPAAPADTESDPVTTTGSAVFRSGKLNVQMGRDHRITSPRVGLAGYVDAFVLGGVALKLDLTLDKSGYVRQVAIAKSSGSTNLDQVWRVVAYQWWFAPTRDNLGRPHEESLTFEIRFM